jgi:hypothetical protein
VATAYGYGHNLTKAALWGLAYAALTACGYGTVGHNLSKAAHGSELVEEALVLPQLHEQVHLPTESNEYGTLDKTRNHCFMLAEEWRTSAEWERIMGRSTRVKLEATQ